MIGPAHAERGGQDSVLTTDVDDTDGGVAEFSSSLDQKQRSRIIRRARAGAIRVIVCSDGMARGMDLDGVGLVVNYDVPSQAKTYVHRCESAVKDKRSLRRNERWCVVALVRHVHGLSFQAGCAFVEVPGAGSRVQLS